MNSIIIEHVMLHSLHSELALANVPHCTDPGQNSALDVDVLIY